MIKKKGLIKKLEAAKILYILHEHKPLFTVNDSEKMRGEIQGVHTKNLFLKNKKNEYFLFSCSEHQSINLKKLGKSLVSGNLSFAKKNDLKKYLYVFPGSVTPFGLLNDIENKVNFFLDKNLTQNDKINFHPLINTSTITIKAQDFINFLLENKKKINIFDFNTYILIK